MSIDQAQRNEEGFLMTPEPLANELITRVHEGPVTFNRTAETIYFTRNEIDKKAEDGFKKLQVYMAKKEGTLWKEIQKLPFNNISYNYLHPTVSPDEDVMFIASDIPGGFGGMDLYAVYKVDSTWSQLVNLGKEVNTPGNEVFPYVAADGTLYFSSDSHSGLGNLDIFYTTQNPRTEVWNKPYNLGTPFNSPSDDFGFIVDRDNKNGYFSSDRKGGYGADDIYSFFIEGDIQPVAGGRKLDGLVVTDEDGNPMEGVSVSAISFDEISLSADDGQIVKLLPGDGGKDNFILDINSGDMGETASTNAQGKADVSLKRGNYVLKITKDGYLPEYVTITPETDLNNLNVRLRRAVDCVALKGRVLIQGSQTPVSGAEIHIVDVDSEEAVTIFSDRLGNYEYCIPCNRTFAVYAVRSGVSSAPSIASAKNIPCTPGEGINQTLYLGGSPLYAGMTIRLPNIYFNFDDATLRPDAYRDLNEVVGMLNNYPGMKLELASHTDSRGGSAYNLDLSQRRSKSVLRYLISQGIQSDRLQPRGYGESQLRNRCRDGVACSETDHQYNRRTEVKILELGEPGFNEMPVAEKSTGVEGYAGSELTGEPDAEKGGQEGVENPTAETEPERAVTVSLPDNVQLEKDMAGNFAVIAGTFANYEFAVRRVKLLVSLGHMEVNIVKHARNGLYAVWVQAYDDKASAFDLVKDLAKHQLHAYVLKR
jgi:outer membrane protein OmpA-like peptidoglycan-associated protein